MFNKIYFIIIFISLITSCSSVKKSEELSPDTPGYQYFEYNFSNYNLSGWRGPAKAKIINDELHLSSVQGFKYHNISYTNRPDYIEGNIEIDIFPKNGRYSFQTKGNSKSNNILEWGIFTQFRNDSIFVFQNSNNKTSKVFVNYTYEQNTWYTLKFKFNNNLGVKGQFDYWISPKNDKKNKTYLGNFNYLAKQGKLKGVYEFVLSSDDPWKSNSKEGVFDNIKFLVKEQ